jgi:FMN reductase
MLPVPVPHTTMKKLSERTNAVILAYTKAQIVQTFVFIEEKDFHRKEIVNDDVLFRIERLVEDTVVLTETYTKIREENKLNMIFNNK